MSGPDLHLLIVDDDERIRGLLQKYLARNGYFVTTARDAAPIPTSPAPFLNVQFLMTTPTMSATMSTTSKSRSASPLRCRPAQWPPRCTWPSARRGLWQRTPRRRRFSEGASYAQ